MQKNLKRAFGDLEVTTAAGRGSSFEITLDGVVLHSKLNGDGWPVAEKIAEKLSQKLNRAILEKPEKEPEGSPLRTIAMIGVGALLTLYMLLYV